MPTVRILGPVDAVDADGREIDLRGPRHRAVLARLVVARGRTVPLDVLIDDLWGTDLPARPAGSVRTFVAALRTALETERPPRLVVTRGPGYAFEGSVDAWDFEAELHGVPDDAVARLEGALARWRGPALAGLDAPWARGERARLTELRLGAVEALAQARLDAGRPDDAVADLDAHTVEHPWREEGWRLLALALYRARREGDALAVLRRARARLADELGADPGPALAQLETDVLRRAPHLDGAADGLWTTITGLGTLAVHGAARPPPWPATPRPCPPPLDPGRARGPRRRGPGGARPGGRGAGTRGRGGGGGGQRAADVRSGRRPPGGVPVTRPSAPWGPGGGQQWHGART